MLPRPTAWRWMIARSQAVNHLLLLVSRTNLREEGLPGRPWYKNQIYAPGAYTGYGVKTLAGVREAMDQHRWSIAEEESPIIGSVLEAESRAIDAAASRLEAAFSSQAVTQRHHLRRFGDCEPLLRPIELWQSEGTTDEQFGDGDR